MFALNVSFWGCRKWRCWRKSSSCWPRVASPATPFRVEQLPHLWHADLLVRIFFACLHVHFLWQAMFGHASWLVGVSGRSLTWEFASECRSAVIFFQVKMLCFCTFAPGCSDQLCQRCPGLARCYQRGVWYYKAVRSLDGFGHKGLDPALSMFYNQRRPMHWVVGSEFPVLFQIQVEEPRDHFHARNLQGKDTRWKSSKGSSKFQSTRTQWVQTCDLVLAGWNLQIQNSPWRPLYMDIWPQVAVESVSTFPCASLHWTVWLDKCTRNDRLFACGQGGQSRIMERHRHRTSVARAELVCEENTFANICANICNSLLDVWKVMFGVIAPGYEFNIAYKERMESKGLTFSGQDETKETCSMSGQGCIEVIYCRNRQTCRSAWIS